MGISKKLKVRQDQIERVKQAVIDKGYPTQKRLADNLCISRATLSPFLNGKPVGIQNFKDICNKLGVDPQEIADLEDLSDTPQDSDEEAGDPTSWFPEGALPPNSPFYLERPNTESLCYETLVKPGSLIRIKAPKLMGKTSLLFNILAYARREKYNTVYLNLGSVEKEILTGLDRFLRWLCAKISEELELKNQVDEVWNTKILGSSDNCNNYFRRHFLSQGNPPLFLALDGVDRLFPYKEWSESFLLLLRSWHEKSNNENGTTWKRLRLALAHSTEVYIPQNTKISPFNVGVPVELREFDKQQIQDLTKRRGADAWTKEQIQQLTNMIGGHPYLVQLAAYHVCTGKTSLEQLRKNASTEAGVYSHHLRSLLLMLQEAPALSEAMKKVVSTSGWVELDSVQTFQLHSMGLVKQENNYVMPRCHLYREYFHRVLCKESKQ
ncbi:MAG: helix-turn-helix domain-containing protein [Symploca sp. SIO2C1]|nr:helix-turn-helix domain-containing protein [Symploca sp. SIO2C1]